MFKKTIATMVAASVIFGGAMSAPAMAAPGTDKQIIPVIVNGQKIKFPDTEPYINTETVVLWFQFVLYLKCWEQK